MSLFDGKVRFDESERDFQRRVVEFAVLCGWVVFHVPDSRRVTVAGWPDLTMYHTKRKVLCFAELKAEKGRLSVAQKEIHADLALCGYEVQVWRPSDWDNVMRFLEGM